MGCVVRMSDAVVSEKCATLVGACEGRSLCAAAAACVSASSASTSPAPNARVLWVGRTLTGFDGAVAGRPADEGIGFGPDTAGVAANVGACPIIVCVCGLICGTALALAAAAAASCTLSAPRSAVERMASLLHGATAGAGRPKPVGGGRSALSTSAGGRALPPPGLHNAAGDVGPRSGLRLGGGGKGEPCFGAGTDGGASVTSQRSSSTSLRGGGGMLDALDPA